MQGRNTGRPYTRSFSEDATAGVYVNVRAGSFSGTGAPNRLPLGAHRRANRCAKVPARPIGAGEREGPNTLRGP